eukprot:9076680-Pyramimonas_sp.AAC.1
MHCNRPHGMILGQGSRAALLATFELAPWTAGRQEARSPFGIGFPALPFVGWLAGWLAVLGP